MNVKITILTMAMAVLPPVRLKMAIHAMVVLEHNLINVLK